MIIECEFEHIVCQVPSRNISRHNAFIELEFIEEGVPSRKNEFEAEKGIDK